MRGCRAERYCWRTIRPYGTAVPRHDSHQHKIVDYERECPYYAQHLERLYQREMLPFGKRENANHSTQRHDVVDQLQTLPPQYEHQAAQRSDNELRQEE